MLKQSIITVSVGKDYYHQLTRNLIESFLIHNKSEIILNILTDDTRAFLKYQNYTSVHIQKIEIDIEDKSFTAKFYMYENAIAEENLFIDCDCLIYQDLAGIFEAFKGRNFSAIGSTQTEGDFFCNISEIISKFDVPALPVFVGSVYYFKKNEIVKNIFKKAVELKKSYDELGFIRLRNKENEEPLIAVAMALYGETCLNNTHIKADAMFYNKIKSNVIKGTNKNVLLIDNPKAEKIYANTSVKNIPIIHYNASFSDSWNYRLETYRLNNIKKNEILINFSGNLKIKYPAITINFLKNTFRPIYHRCIGVRSIKNSNR